MSAVDADLKRFVTIDDGAVRPRREPVDETARTLFEVLEHQALVQPDKVVFRFLGRALEETASLTYAELHARALEMSRAFAADGLMGKRIVLGQETGPEFVVAFFAAMALDITAVPVATRLLLRPSPALETLLATARPAAILLDAETMARRPLPHLENLWPWSRASAELHSAEPASAARDRFAVMQFTSGSTSAPKGVCISHENFISNAGAINRAHDLSGPDLAVSWLPLFHDMGLMLGVVWPVMTGAASVLMAPSAFVSRPGAWLEAIARYGATVSSSPNFGYQACLDRVGDDEIAGLDLSRWRIAICGAEPVRPETVDRFIERFGHYGMSQRTLAPAYGLAEATVFVSGGPNGPRPQVVRLDESVLRREGKVLRAGETDGDIGTRRVVSCGPVADNIEVVIVDPAGPTVLGDGRVGEIWIAGPSVAHGYFNAEEATRETFQAHLPGRSTQFLRTGDLGFLLDGELFVSGRLKDLIIVRGVKYHPHDIEATVRTVDPVLETADSAAFVAEVQGGFENEPDDERIVVAVELGSALDEMPRLAEAVRQAVSSVHGLHLDTIAFVGKLRLPRTTSGKIRRRETARQWQEEELKTLAVFTADEVEAPPHLGPASTLERVCEIWRAMLGARQVEPDGNFFEMGGDSVRLAAALVQLKEISDVPLGLSDLFEHPSPRSLAAFIESGGAHHGVAEAQARGQRRRAMLGQAATDGIAIVGMAARFPGAPDVASFWAGLHDGKVLIARPDATAAGWDDAAGTVQASATLDGADLFDADYFGISGMEAAAMDPQQRVLLECAHEALESAGCDPERAGRVGVYVGSGMNPNRLALLGPDLAETDVAGRWLTILGNDKDYLASRIAYKLGLRGPSLTIQTACSTSLVAVHVACQALLSGECDVALAGGATVANSLDPKGYRAEIGDVCSADGRCRPFDAEAGGTVFGDGAGVVALRRLADAIADGDHIHAIVLGSATNNDGAERVGYSAPGISGQAAVIAEAIAAAGIAADEIGYVEAHGTGTPLGDPVEVTALTRAFRGSTPKKGFCALGSVKANIGHASAAAGIAGLIKSVLALENEAIPPNPELDNASPAIDFANSPFVLGAEGRAWPRGERKRIAGISSFGMGGVNAHVILAEAPLQETAIERPRDEILFLSAKSAVALEDLTDQLAWRFAGAEPARVADAAWTFAAGRRVRAHRRAVVLDSAETGVQSLVDRDPRRVRSAVAAHAAPPVVFTIPGSGSQRLGMGASTYRREPVYRAMFDRCAELFLPIIGLDLRTLIFDPAASGEADPAATLARASIAQPAQFAVSVSLAAQWAHWGIKPAALIGHSFGEIVAAHLAGVFTLEDAARLVAMRGRMVETTEAGAMIAVLAPLAAFEALLGADITIACHNGPAAYTLSGTQEAVMTLDTELTARGILCRTLRTDRAFHSALMADIVAPYVDFVRTLRRRAPKIPFVSTVTGRWIGKSEAMDPSHWGRQLVEPVRFAEGLAALGHAKAGVFLEVGPGRALTTFVEQNLVDHDVLSVASLGQPDGSAREQTGLLCAAGELWTAGCALDTKAFGRAGARKVALPTHPMRRKRYVLAADQGRGHATRAPSGSVLASSVVHEDALPRPQGGAVFAEAGSELEKAVNKAWRDSLGLKAVGMDDDFFELGGHSLIAAGAARRLAATLERPVGIADIFRFPTPRRMATYLAQDMGPSRASASA